jgi:hypothetical protein
MTAPRNMAEVREANQKADFHWFDASTLRFFDSHPGMTTEPCGSMCRFCSLRCERKAGHYPATVHEAEGETWEDPGRAPLPLSTYKGIRRAWQAVGAA